MPVTASSPTAGTRSSTSSTRRACGSRWKCIPTEIAYDIYTAEKTLDALNHREAFGFNFDPSHLIHQQFDPVEFINAFPDRIYHVHVKDSKVSAQRTDEHSRLAPQLRRLPARLELRLAGARRRRSRRASFARSTASATTVRSRSSGKTAAWIASTARARRSSSSSAPISRPRRSPSTRRSGVRNSYQPSAVSFQQKQPRPLTPSPCVGGTKPSAAGLFLRLAFTVDIMSSAVLADC